ncbi:MULTISPECIES: capsular polysaccharide synthesis protein [unclassified Ruegeria]|uniref:capsular polysaccharide synthesis protein n=1 Tax=unclassified Ruegeria TaxID=2625375 RepID=UPI001AE617BD
MRIPRFWVFAFILLVYARVVHSLAGRAINKVAGRPEHFSRSAPRNIPKNIWIYWDRGEENAPEIVRHCIASWRDRNPGWEVRVLDNNTVAEVTDLPHDPEKLSVQSYADLLRLRLLRKHGGVWADATTYCLSPLDQWLPPVAQRGFFAFTWTRNDRWFIWPGIRRSLTNWFLAAEPEGALISHWEKASFKYWEGRTKPHNYYWPHILVDYLYMTSYSFRQTFDEFPKIGCYSAHLIHDCVEHTRNTDEIITLLRTNSAPVQKLRWDWNEQRVAATKEILGIQEASQR